jgi:hypothetical protein
MDMGRISTAKVSSHALVSPKLTMQEQLDLLARRFPDSPRVDILKGLRLEAENDLQGAQKVYSALLAKDETNVVCPISQQ